MNEYCVNCDVTFSGDFYIRANSEEEAREKVNKMCIVPSDIRNFYLFDTSINEVELEEENVEVEV